MWHRTEYEMTCLICGRVYSLTSEWDRANIDWHEHDKEGV